MRIRYDAEFELSKEFSMDTARIMIDHAIQSGGLIAPNSSQERSSQVMEIKLI